MRKIILLLLIISSLLINCKQGREVLVVTDHLRIRNKPSLEADIIKLLVKGDKLYLLDIEETKSGDKSSGYWVKVYTYNYSNIGWCFVEYDIENILTESEGKLEKYETTKYYDKVEDFYNNPFVRNKVPPREELDIEIIQKEYGKVEKIETKEIISRHDGSPYDLKTIKCKDVIFTYDCDKQNISCRLMAIRLFNNNIKLKYGIKIGLYTYQIRNILGKPDYAYELKDGLIQYNYEALPGFETVTFIFNEDNRVKEIIVMHCPN